MAVTKQLNICDYGKKTSIMARNQQKTTIPVIRLHCGPYLTL